jgi:hypothetical protein
MPNALVHYHFAKKYGLDEGEHWDAAFLGAQGPDPFFFFGTANPLFRPHHKTVSSLGGITQHQALAKPYAAMMRYAYKSPDKSLLFSYIDGLLMHYVVDCACHPFIFYRTGFTDREEDSSEVQHHYNYSHMCFEVIADYLLSKKEGDFPAIFEVLRLSNRDLHAISRMWWAVNKEVQKVPYVTPNSFYYAVKDYRRTEHMAIDHSGRKKALAKRIFGPESYGYGMIFPQNLDQFKGIDFLNEAHAPWRMPAGEWRTESFEDLLDKAAIRYRGLHSLLLQAEAGEDIEKALDELSEGLNHEGIIPHSPKIYWKLIWPESFFKDTIPHNEPKE